MLQPIEWRVALGLLEHSDPSRPDYGLYHGTSGGFKNVSNYQAFAEKYTPEGLGRAVTRFQNYRDDVRGNLAVNEALRTGAQLTPGQQEVVAGMDAAIAKAPPLEEDVFLYRGAGSRLGGVKRGDRFVDHGFSYASTDVSIARLYGNSHWKHRLRMDYPTLPSPVAIVRFKVPAGTRVLPMEQASRKLGIDAEASVVLARNLTWRVESTKHLSDYTMSRGDEGETVTGEKMRLVTLVLE